MELEVKGRRSVELLEVLADFEAYEAKYQTSDEWRDDLDYIYPVYSNSREWPFAHHLGNIKPGGVYLCHKAIARIYTNLLEMERFKNRLALMALGTSLHKVRQSPGDFEEAPF